MGARYKLQVIQVRNQVFHEKSNRSEGSDRNTPIYYVDVMGSGKKSADAKSVGNRMVVVSGGAAMDISSSMKLSVPFECCALTSTTTPSLLALMWTAVASTLNGNKNTA